MMSAPSRTRSVIARRTVVRLAAPRAGHPAASATVGRPAKAAPGSLPLGPQPVAEAPRLAALALDLAPEALDPLPRPIALPGEPFVVGLQGLDALASSLALHHQPALGPSEQLHGIEFELGPVALQLAGRRLDADGPRLGARERVGTARQQTRQALVAHQAPGANTLLHPGVVHHEVGVQLVEPA